MFCTANSTKHDPLKSIVEDADLSDFIQLEGVDFFLNSTLIPVYKESAPESLYRFVKNKPFKLNELNKVRKARIFCIL